MVRSYEAGFLWGFNMLFELSSRGVKRANIHGVGLANFASIYMDFVHKDSDVYNKIIVTPIYFAMYLFNRLMDGGENSVLINVPHVSYFLSIS